MSLCKNRTAGRRRFTRQYTVVSHPAPATPKRVSVPRRPAADAPRLATCGTGREPAHGRFVIAMKQAIAPIGEARDDYAVFADLADRFGSREAFTEGRNVHPLRSAFRYT